MKNIKTLISKCCFFQNKQFLKKRAFIKKMGVVLLSVFTMLSVAYFDTSKIVEAYSANLYTITWNDGSNSLIQTPSSNTKQSTTMQLKFSMGAGVSAAPGEIEIRLPRYLFFDRDGNPIDDVSVPLVQAPGVGGGTSFNYAFEGDEIVIRNYETVGSSSYFNCSITYGYMPKQIQSGYTNDMQADFKIAIAGKPVENFSSNKIDVTVNTSQNLNVTTEKVATKKTEVWNDKWKGITKPADADKYFYVWWDYKISDKANIQPITYRLSEDAGAHGTIVGWIDNYNGYGAETDFIISSGDFNASHQGKELSGLGEDAKSTQYYMVLVKYPKSILNTVSTFENKITFVGESIDDRTAIHSSATGSYTYQSVDFDYEGNSFSTSKGFADSSSKDNHIDLTPFLNGKEDQELKFSLNAISRGYGLTKEGTQFGVHSYTNTVIDDQVYIGNERLEKGDYIISSFRPSSTQTTAILDPDKGMTTIETSPNNRTEMKIYMRTSDEAPWEYFGRADYRVFIFADNTSVNLSNGVIPVPVEKGYTQIKMVDETKAYSSNYWLQVGIKLKLSTHVKELLDKVAIVTNGHNVSSFVVTDHNEEIANSVGTGTITGTLKDEIIAHDQKMYGNKLNGLVVQHGQEEFLIRDPVPSADSKKNMQYIQNDIENQQFKLKVQLNAYTTLSEMAGHGYEELGLDKYIKTQKQGVFYDLLPKGSTIDLSSVKIYTNTGYTSGVSESDRLDSSIMHIEVIDNWRNSGQTMVVIRVDNPDAKLIYEPVNKNYKSGYDITFDLLYSYQSYFDYGSDLKNNFAYQSQEGYLGKGASPDDPYYYSSGVYQEAKEYFKDLNQDGNPVGSELDTVYSRAIVGLGNQSIASQAGYSKTVKAIRTDISSDFSESAEAITSGDYIYQLRYVNGATTVANGLVFYDVLEQAMGNETNFWRGTLKEVDVSYAKSKGIEPVVYYSTKDRNLFNLSQTGKGDQDLSDTTVWSTTAPDDLSKVTAVAIDLSKKTDGSLYTVPFNSSVLVQLRMSAPTIYTPALAHNNSYSRVSTASAGGGAVTESSEVSSKTEVSIKKPEGALFSFTKTDESGNVLKDAQFTLYQCKQTGADHTHDDVYSLSTMQCWEEYTTVVSDENGMVDFATIPFGEYQLVETKAPNGYQLPSGQWRIVVGENGEINISAKGKQLPPAFKLEEGGNWSLMNYKKNPLPLSGGTGQLVLTFGGVLLICTSLLLGCTKKRKR